jgi:type VI secretion system protein ImpH
MGPMDFDTYRKLLPDGASLKRLEAWVRNYIGDELAWDLQLVLRADEVPQTRLGMVGQLGWSSWAHSGSAGADRDDLTLDVTAN